jgi:hypothetical protein
MAQKKNKNKQSGQLARQSQNNSSNNKNSAPIAFAVGQKSSTPKVFNGKRMIRVTHRELVTTISGSTTFEANSFSLNPGLASTFPWLSTIADSFEQYRFNRLRFHYVTRAPSTYIGSILMAPDYDALDSAPSSEIIASQMDGAVEDSPWKEQILDLSVQDMFPMGPRKYVRTSSISSSDLKTYDAGNVFVCAVACTDTSALGKLWVEYDVELHIPQNPTAVSNSAIGASAFYQLAGGDQSLNSGTAATILFDTEIHNSLAATLSSGVITLPAGKYQITVVASASGAAGVTSLFLLEAWKDGSALASPVQSRSDYDANVIDPSQSLQYFVEDTSSFTTAVRVTYTSASGTLILDDQRSTISIVRVL